ncbi:MAG TPA: helix-turn-helix transcriptional regulator [Solirubrobacteraceae bacterium]
MIDAAQLVREARRRQGISQAELARRAGTSQHAVSLIERGLRRPSLDTLERLLLVTGHRVAGELEVIPSEEDPIHLAAAQRQTVGERVHGGFNGVELFNLMHGIARR